jgi:bifunctional UDP-N-acetylglucosamine pyrophosphorylase/glucosamine-1-phosphate N-acetyltransferase
VKRLLVIPAAGLGTRLQSRVPKVLHPIDGRPALDHLLDLYAALVDRIVLVLHPSFEAAVRAALGQRPEPPEILFQDPPAGMLPAILVPQERVNLYRPEHVWVTWCDQVAVHRRTVERLAELSESDPHAALTLPTVWRDDPYIHFVRDGGGTIVEVRHRREGDELPRRGESDAGLFCFSLEAYTELLPAFARTAPPGANTGEANFLPFIPWVARQRRVQTFTVEHELESVGINTPDDVRRVEEYLRSVGRRL